MKLFVKTGLEIQIAEEITILATYIMIIQHYYSTNKKDINNSPTLEA